MSKYIETYRNIVSPAELDHLGHMNAQYYFAAIGGGITSFQIALGLTPSDMREGRRLAFVVVHGDTDFRAELKAGDVIRLETGVTEIANKTATFHHRLLKVETETLSFEAYFKCVLLNLDTRRAVEIPEDIRKKLEAYLV
ncbi:MAG: hypothetical protein GKS00_03200 [Alphaproteobacteria bacterium]|nr:hypothetical protein [Alphaproteobacteria bacterium]